MNTSHCKRRFIITGHSRGLGAAFAARLLDAGHAVMGISRHAPADEKRTAANRSEPAGLHTVLLDLADTEALCKWLATGELQTWLAGAEQAVLINNAGRVSPIALAGGAGNADLAVSLALNITAPLLISNTFVTATAGCTDRRIVHISSGAARSPYAGWSAYCAAKSALDHHAACLAIEGHAGLRIASVAPGVIDTDMQAEIRQTAPDQFPLLDRFVKMKAGGALSSPDDVARRLLHYVLEDASFGKDSRSDLRALSS